MTAIERLERLLNKKDKEIERLQADLARAQEEAEADHTWTRHRVYEKPESAPGADLPLPRLEMRWQEIEHPRDGYTLEAAYCLVYRHLLGHTEFVPLGLTRSSGSLARRLLDNGSVDLPFRDGAHFANEMRQLRLRGFGIVGDHVHEYRFCSRCGRLDFAHREGEGFDERCTLPRVGTESPDAP